MNDYNTNKHLLFLVASLGVGGAQKIASYVMNLCVDNGYKISVLSLGREEPNVDLNNTIQIHNIEYSNRDSRIKSKMDEIFESYKICKKINPDIIVIFGSYTIPSLGILMSGIPIIGCERGDPFTYSKFRQLVNKMLYKRYDFSVFQTNEARDYYKLDSLKTAVIANPCFQIKKKDTVIREKVIVGAGRLTEDKGFDTLIEAFSQLDDSYQDYQLVIYGDGPYKKNLSDLIFSLSLEDRVSLYGKVKYLTDYIYNASLFVLSSWYEGLPNVLIEAMSLGLPIVATDCSPGGARFLMQDGKIGGEIVPIKNVSAMRKAIEYSLGNQSYAIELGEKGRNILDLYAPDIIANQWLKIFDEF